MDPSDSLHCSMATHMSNEQETSQAQTVKDRRITATNAKPAVAYLVDVDQTKFGTVEDDRRRRAVWRTLYLSARRKNKTGYKLLRSPKVRKDGLKQFPHHARCQILTTTGLITVNDLHPNGLHADDLAYWPMWETSDGLPGCPGYGFKDGVPTSSSYITYARDRGAFRILRRTQNALAAKEHADRLAARLQRTTLETTHETGADDQAALPQRSAKSSIVLGTMKLDTQRQMEEMREKEDLLEIQNWNPELSLN